jgi:hypothetical protein
LLKKSKNIHFKYDEDEEEVKDDKISKNENKKRIKIRGNDIYIYNKSV